MDFEFKPGKLGYKTKDEINTDYEFDKATVTIDQNKLILSQEAIKALNASPGDRIAINYWTVNSWETFPLIGKAEMFSDSEGGNRLTKSKTVSFRGNQRDILKEYGTLFRVIPFNNYYKLEPIKIEEVDNFQEEKQDLENLT
jgi:hypothetical protein